MAASDISKNRGGAVVSKNETEARNAKYRGKNNREQENEGEGAIKNVGIKKTSGKTYSI